MTSYWILHNRIFRLTPLPVAVSKSSHLFNLSLHENGENSEQIWTKSKVMTNVFFPFHFYDRNVCVISVSFHFVPKKLGIMKRCGSNQLLHKHKLRLSNVQHIKMRLECSHMVE